MPYSVKVPPIGADSAALTMRLSAAGMHQRKSKAVYPDHSTSPWLVEDAARDRSNRWLGDLSVTAEKGVERGGTTTPSHTW